MVRIYVVCVDDFSPFFLQKQDPPPAQPEVLSLLSVDPSSSKPSHPSPQLDAPWTLNAGDTASLTSSPFITNDLSKSASSKMGCIKLASSPSRSEVGSSEESVSEAADDSLHGNPSPCCPRALRWAGVSGWHSCHTGSRPGCTVSRLTVFLSVPLEQHCGG